MRVRFTCVALNNESGLLIVCVLEDMTKLACRITNAFALLFCLLCACPYPTNAQQAETYVVPVTVVSRDGKPLTSLQSQNVRIHNRGVELKSFSLDTSPRRIVLLFDTSGSMRISNGKVTLWDAAVHTAELFLDRVPPTDWISVYAFANQDKQLVPFTRDHGAIRAAIHGLPQPGTEEAEKEYGVGTQLDTALNSILSLLSESSQFGDAIVIFSDGLLPRSNGDRIMVYYDQPDYLQRITPRLGTLGVRVFFSLAGNIVGTPPLHGMELFIGATGGESFELNESAPPLYGMSDPYSHPEAPIYRSNSLEQRALALCAEIQDTYRLQLQFAGPLEKPSPLRLGFVDERGRVLHNVTVLSPQSIYPKPGTPR